MTSDDQAFFTANGDDLVPSPIARGPWGTTISGTYVGRASTLFLRRAEQPDDR